MHISSEYYVAPEVPAGQLTGQEYVRIAGASATPTAFPSEKVAEQAPGLKGPEQIVEKRKATMSFAEAARAGASKTRSHPTTPMKTRLRNVRKSKDRQSSSSLSPAKGRVSASPGSRAASRNRTIEGKVFVGGLHYHTTAAGLRQYFKKFGNILATEVLYNRDTGKSRGFGFVTFDDEAAVDRVVQNRMHMIDEKKVRTLWLEI